MKIIITCALLLEFNEARNQLGLKEITEKSDIPRIAVNGDIHLVYSGIGKVNTVVNLFGYLKNIKPDLVVDSGTCGSLIETLVPLDIVVSTESIEFFSYNLRGHNFSCNKSGIRDIIPGIVIDDYIVASIEDSVITPEHKKKLLDNGTSVVTWETSAIFSLCNKLQVPFVSIRGVTDSCNEHTHQDFKINRKELCKKIYNSIKMLCKGI